MSDLRERFKLADGLDVPDLWGDVVARAGRDERRVPVTPNGPGVGSRLVAALVALLVFAGAAILVWRAFQQAPSTVDQPQPRADPWYTLTSGLNEFPPPPSARFGSAHVWTGIELVVWGGAQDDGAVRFDDGFTLDPLQRRWTAMPPSPLKARYFPASVWTEKEVLVWGGWESQGTYLSDGAAFEPATGMWRMLPEAPITYGRSLSVWTGSEMLVWNPDDGTGAAYNPTSDSWRRIGDAPFPLERANAAIWTGAEMIVLGMSSDGGHEEIRARGLSYQASTDAWAELPRPDLSENAVSIVWTGSEVIGVDYNHRVQSFRPGDDSWSVLPRVPLEDGEGGDGVAFAAGDLFVDTPAGQILMDVASGVWGATLPPLRPGDGYLEPVSAGDAIVLLQGSPTSPAPDTMFVWKAGSSDSVPSEVSDELRVRCTEGGVEVTTPVVETQVGGVAVSVSNPASAKLLEFHSTDAEDGSAFGGDASDGASYLRWIEPGRTLVACLETVGQSYSDVLTQEFEVIDPGQHWIEPGLDCDTPEVDAPVSGGFEDVPDDRLFDELPTVISGLQPTDRFRGAGYEGTAWKLWRYWGIVIRNGERIASVKLGYADDLTIESCVPDVHPAG